MEDKVVGGDEASGRKDEEASPPSLFPVNGSLGDGATASEKSTSHKKYNKKNKQ
jgi:hypothetical protein